jgi:hypothetical protein
MVYLDVHDRTIKVGDSTAVILPPEGQAELSFVEGELEVQVLDSEGDVKDTFRLRMGDE